MKGWDDPRQLRTFRVVLAEVDRRGLGALVAQQAIAVVMVECSGLNYANPLYPWTLAGSDGYPPTELAPSTKESCGITQIRPHIPQWWGPQGLSIHDQALFFMSPVNSINLFLDRLIGTVRTNQPWRQIQEVQGSEYNGATRPYAGNYQAAWDSAGVLLTLLRSERPGTVVAPPPPTFIEGVLMSKAVEVFFEHPKGTVYEASLLRGVYWHIVNDDAYTQRRAVLDTYGIPYATEGVVDVPAKFGIEVSPVTPSPSIYQLYRAAEGGTVLAVYPGGWYHVPTEDVLTFMQNVGIFSEIEEVDVNTLNWIKTTVREDTARVAAEAWSDTGAGPAASTEDDLAAAATQLSAVQKTLASIVATLAAQDAATEVAAAK